MQPFSILFIASFASSLIPSILACGRDSDCEQNKKYLDKMVVPGLHMTFPDVMNHYVRKRIGGGWAEMFQKWYGELDNHDAKRLHAAFKLINTVNHPNEKNDLMDMINSYPRDACSYKSLCHVVNFAVNLKKGKEGSSSVQSRTGNRGSSSVQSRNRPSHPRASGFPHYAGNGYRQPLSPEEIAEILEVHNKYRAMHGASPLKWSDDLFKTMNGLWDHNGDFEHKKSGENLAAYSGSDYSFGEAIKAWYDEVSIYDYGNHGFSKATGHFTQVVWKSTKSVACQKNIIPGQKWQSIIICHYDPPGNVIGHFSSNVLPVSG